MITEDSEQEETLWHVIRHIWKGEKLFWSEKGMGLAEALISVAIVGIAITALVSSLSTGSLAVQKNEVRVTADNLARMQMESIKGETYSSGGSYTIINAPIGYSIAANTMAVGGRSINEIQKVTVTISHDSDTVSLEDYKVNR